MHPQCINTALVKNYQDYRIYALQSAFVAVMHWYSANEILGSTALVYHDDICHFMATCHLTGAALVHHADPWGVSQPHKVSMMLECSTGELLIRSAFMHHDDQGHDALRHDAVLKGLTGSMLCSQPWGRGHESLTISPWIFSFHLSHDVVLCYWVHGHVTITGIPRSWLALVCSSYWCEVCVQWHWQTIWSTFMHHDD